MTTAQAQTPMMSQWQACKGVARDAILLFRMGDFYEAFYEDASILARELDLTLTKRQEVPMSGVPHHSSAAYIDKLVGKGYRVAIAEQMEDPKKGGGLVKREVVRIITPGTVIDSSLLSDKANNFFACVTQVGDLFGLAFLDLTTSDFRAAEFDQRQELINEIYRLNPSEFLVPQRFEKKQIDLMADIRQSYRCVVNTEEDWRFEHDLTYNFLVKHLKVHNLDGFGLRGKVAAINAAGALLQYMQRVLCLPLDQIKGISGYSTAQFLSIDRISQRNLELTRSLYDGSRTHTLLEVLDHTRTSMGARMMQHWIKNPLVDVAEIRRRQDGVQVFYERPELIEQINSRLVQMRDVERLMMKIDTGYASPRDLIGLRLSFETLPSIQGLLEEAAPYAALIQEECAQLNGLPEMTDLIKRALVDDPPAKINEGYAIRDGFNAELDELRQISQDSKSWLTRYQASLRGEYGIKTLKIGYTKMFGYYIEVSKGQLERVPEVFQRRQTLVNGERFITPELKEFESKLLTAEDRMAAIEQDLFQALRKQVGQFAGVVGIVSRSIATIDCLISLAHAARKCGYYRPIADHSHLIEIVEGRHPVIEGLFESDQFVPNDTAIDNENQRLLLITGPNMAGKSTYLRQVALIVIMTQMGSFVPAKSAHIGIVDKLFTRVGASDDLSRGQSTFMVEMTETANILHHVTSRSLVLLDEIGRGTSTYDGISIAWSVAEYLLTTAGKQAKTLFATHYCELTQLEDKLPGAVNYHVAVNESEDEIRFLRKIIKGGTDKSYGIHVARLAGLPPSVISRAEKILEQLEENANRKGIFEPSKVRRKTAEKEENSASQLTLF